MKFYVLYSGLRSIYDTIVWEVEYKYNKKYTVELIQNVLIKWWIKMCWLDWLNNLSTKISQIIFDIKLLAPLI